MTRATGANIGVGKKDLKRRPPGYESDTGDFTMSLTHKERMRLALQHQPIDRIPTQMGYTGDMGAKIAKHLSVSVDDLPTVVDNHMIRVDLSYPKRFNDDGSLYYDWWGVGWSTHEEGYLPAECPLAGNDNLADYPWPDPDDPHLLDEAARIIKADNREHFITPNFGFALFERAWTLRGLENFMMDMLLKPDFANELLDRITDIQVKLIKRYLDLGMDGGYFGDDYGAQKGMLFSPASWREMIKPRLARMFAPFKAAGMPILMHSDGQIGDILPDLVEIGLTTLNPVQPEILDHTWLKQTFGNQLSYYGGVSTQTVLPSGTPAEVQAAAGQAIRLLAPHNTGLMLAPSHRMMVDIPLENVEALLSVFEQMGEAV